MKELTVRTWHRALGKALALLFILQGASGLYLTVKYGWQPQALVQAEGLSDWISAVHYGGGGAGSVYRLVVGLGLLAQTLLGGIINLKIRARQKQTKP